MVKAVIFDMDGVLIDTEKYYVNYWVKAGKAAGWPMTWEHGLFLRSFAGKYAAPVCRGVFGERFDYAGIREQRKQMMEPVLNRAGIEKKPGADEILDYLKERGIKTAVATASDLSRAEQYLTQISLIGKFDEIICVDMVKNGKPMPDTYLYACRRLGFLPSECLAVEDSPNGVIAAYTAGCRVVMVPDLSEPDEAVALMLDAKVDNLKALMGVIR